MVESNLAGFASPQLFQLCAAHPQHEEYWLEFVRRFNTLLVRSIVTAWRRCGQGDWPPDELADDLLQDVYLIIAKNDFRFLRNFRGQSNAEAEAYLAHAAINQTISFLRARQAQRRAADEISLQALLDEQGEGALTGKPRPAAPGLTESELLTALEKCCDGSNAERDIVIFMLYAQHGYSAAEIAKLGVVELRACTKTKSNA